MADVQISPQEFDQALESPSAQPSQQPAQRQPISFREWDAALPDGRIYDPAAAEAATQAQGAPIRDVLGTGWRLASRAPRAAVADIASVMAGQPAENLATVGTDILWPGTKPTPLPIEKQLSEAEAYQRERGEVPWASMVGKASQQITGDIPKFAAVAATGGAGVIAASIAAGGLFGTDEEGNFHPKEALVMSLLPGVGKLARLGTASILGRATAAGVKGLESEQVRKVLEEVGHQAALDGYMTLTSAPELIQQYRQDPKQAAASVASIIFQNLGFALLGADRFRTGAPSDTMNWIKDKASGMAEDAIKARIAQDYTGQQLRDIYIRVSKMEGTPEEENLVKFVTEQLGAQAVTDLTRTRSGAVRVTKTEYDFSKIPEFWKKYVPSGPTESAEVIGAPEGKQPAPQPPVQPAAAPTVPLQLAKEFDNAVNPVSEPGSVPVQPEGVAPVGQEGQVPSVGNRVPSPAGQPALVPPVQVQAPAAGPVVAPVVAPKPAPVVPTLAKVQKGAPPPPTGNIPIRIQTKDGAIVPAVFGGYWEMPGLPMDKTPNIGYVAGDTWSHTPIHPGDTILDKVPSFDEWKAAKLKAEPRTPKSSTQLTLPPAEAAPFVQFAQSIPDSEVYHKPDENGKEDFGIETQPHITVLFGLTKHEPAPVAKAVADHGPVEVTLGKLSVFKNKEYDVLKVDVSGPAIHALNKKVSKLPNEQTYPDYHPHLTIAYLKPGEGEKYEGSKIFEGKKLTFNSMTFSPPSEVRAQIGKPDLPLVTPVTESGTKGAKGGTKTPEPETGKPISETTTESANPDAAKKFRKMAESLEPQIEDKRRPMTQNPTPKRMREYKSRLHDGENLARTRDALLALAAAHESGTVPKELADLKSKKEVEPLIRKGTEPGGYYDVIPSQKYNDDSPKGKAMQALIETPLSPQQAAAKAERDRQMKITELEDKLRFSDIPGFFPTPKPLAEEMVRLADIQPGQTVLEPSAGKGDLADVVKEQAPGADVTTVERMTTLREILKLKGYKVEGEDFMEHKGTYDRIVMNPPFEKGLDAKHVREAYDHLKPGGKVVALMSEGTFSRSSAAPFREWLAKVDGQTEKVDAGAFKGVGAFRQTGVATRIVEITKPVRQGSLAIHNEAERAKEGKSDVETTISDLKGALQTSGLSEEAQHYLGAYLESPLAKKAEDGLPLRLRVAEAIDGGLQGSYLEGIATVTRDADPITVIHEILHHIWGGIMPNEIKAEMERLRVETLNDLAAEARDNGQEELAKAFERLRDNPTSGGDQFLASGYPAAMTGDLYPLSSAEEFFTHTGSEQFKARVGTKVEGFWARLKGIIKDFVAAVRKALGLKQGSESWFRNILRGNFEAGTPEMDNAILERHRQASLSPDEQARRQDAISEGIKEMGMKPTEVFGTVDYVDDRHGLGPEVAAASMAKAQTMATQAGFQTSVQSYPDPTTGQVRAYMVFNPTGFDMDAEGRKLIEMVKAELAKISPLATPDSHPAELSALLGSMRFAGHLEALGIPSAVDTMSQPVKDEFFRVAQTPVSWAATFLGAQSYFKPDLIFQGTNVHATLYYQMYQAYGGEHLAAIVDRIVTSFRDYFSEDEIKKALESVPALQALLDKAMALNRAQGSNRLVRKVDQLMAPKAKKKIGALEADARLNEEVAHILDELKKQGLEPRPSPNKPLTPIQRLIYMVNPATADKINAEIEKAVTIAERRAGIKAALMQAKSPEEISQLETDFQVGAEPSPEQIEAGLSLPEFAHWKVLRDNMLDYSPVTVKLVQDLIRSDFKGTKFGPGKEKAQDLRLDLNKLAKTRTKELGPGDPGPVGKVMEAYLDAIGEKLNLSKASPETREKILAIVYAEVTNQLEAARARVREPMFQPPKERGAVLTPEQRLGQQVNAGLLGDPRLNSADVVKQVAAKSVLQRVTPTLTDLTKLAMETPFYRQSDLPDQFAKALAERLGLTEEQANQGRGLFAEAFKQPMAKAFTRAIAKARDALTPQEIEAVKPSKGLWKKIVELFNATSGDGMTVGSVLDEIAAAHGQKPPSSAQKARLKALAQRILRLSDPTDEQKSDAAGDVAKLALAKKENEAINSVKIADAVREMGVQWAKITRPISFLHWWSTRANLALAIQEYGVANSLFKPGWVLYRIWMHIGSQAFVHMLFRPIGGALGRWSDDLAKGRDTMFWRDVVGSIGDQWGQTIGSLGAAMRQARRGLTGHPDAKNLDQLGRGVQAVERMLLSAKEHYAKGDYVQAFLIYAACLPKFSFNVLDAVDGAVGVGIERSEFPADIRSKLREMGKSPAEIEARIDDYKTAIKTMLLQARVDAEKAMQGESPTEAQVNAAADALLRERLYAWLETLNMAPDEFRAKNESLVRRETWKAEVHHGLGGAVTQGLQGTQQFFNRALGVPMDLTFFSRAIGNGINLMLSGTPLYWQGAIPIGKNAGPSPFFADKRSWMQAHTKAAFFSAIGTLLFILAATGKAPFIGPKRRTKAEHDQLVAEGHKVGTMEFYNPDGTFRPVSTSVGFLQHFAPWIVAGGAMYDLFHGRAKAQDAMNKEAEKLGLTPGKIKPISVADMVIVGLNAAWGILQANKAVGGITGSMTELGVPNPTKAVAARISPYLPGVPGWQEISRGLGISIDPALASVWDYVIPTPGSGARALNFMGDPVKTPDDVQRWIQSMTGGTFGIFPLYVGSVNPKPAEIAYQTLFESGFRPPAINLNKGYSIDGQFRPMTEDEAVRYTQARGEAFKQQLSGVGPGADLKTVSEAFKTAQDEALASVGASVVSRAAASGSPIGATGQGQISQTGARPMNLPGVPASGGATGPRGGAMRVPGRSLFRRARSPGARSGLSHGPSLRREPGSGGLRAPPMPTGRIGTSGGRSLRPRRG